MRATPDGTARRGGPAEEPALGEADGSPVAPGEPAAGRGAILAREAARKVVHVGAGIVAAILAWVLPDAQRRGLFLGAAALAIALDLGRLALPGLGRYFLRALEPMLRGKELRHITGATTLAIGFMAAVVLFPRPAAIAGLLYGGLGDAAGALVGRAFGRHRYPGGKSVEGSIAFLATAFAIGWALPALGPAAALGVAFLLTLLEAIPLPFDDNLLIPLAGAALTFFASRLA